LLLFAIPDMQLACDSGLDASGGERLAVVEKDRDWQIFHMAFGTIGQDSRPRIADITRGMDRL